MLGLMAVISGFASVTFLHQNVRMTEKTKDAD